MPAANSISKEGGEDGRSMVLSQILREGETRDSRALEAYAARA